MQKFPKDKSVLVQKCPDKSDPRYFGTRTFWHEYVDTSALCRHPDSRMPLRECASDKLKAEAFERLVKQKITS